MEVLKIPHVCNDCNVQFQVDFIDDENSSEDILYCPHCGSKKIEMITELKIEPVEYKLGEVIHNISYFVDSSLMDLGRAINNNDNLKDKYCLLCGELSQIKYNMSFIEIVYAEDGESTLNSSHNDIREILYDVIDVSCELAKLKLMHTSLLFSSAVNYLSVM